MYGTLTQIKFHGATKEIYRIVLDSFSCVNRSFDFRHLYALGVADADSSVSDNGFCEGDGSHVELSLIIFFIAVS